VSLAISAFRDRRALFAVLLAVLAANAAVLLSYRTFYDERLQALVNEQAALESARDEARRLADEAASSERRLFEMQETLTTFFSETLGTRQERLAPLLEEVYRTTREAGLRPDTISYTSFEEPGTNALTMTFSVQGPYGDVKKVLSGLESSRRFLVVEEVGLTGGDADDPNVVRVALTVTNFFRPGSLRPIRAVRDTRGRPSAARGRGASR